MEQTVMSANKISLSWWNYLWFRIRCLGTKGSKQQKELHQDLLLWGPGYTVASAWEVLQYPWQVPGSWWLGDPRGEMTTWTPFYPASHRTQGLGIWDCLPNNCQRLAESERRHTIRKEWGTRKGRNTAGYILRETKGHNRSDPRNPHAARDSLDCTSQRSHLKSHSWV